MKELTVKLNEVVNYRLPQSMSALLLLKDAYSLRLALIHNQKDSDRNREPNQDDAERTESPAVRRVLIEQLGDLGTSKSRRQTETHVEPPHDHVVAERSNVGDDDIDYVAETNVPNSVERMAGSVGFYVLAKRLEDDADDDEEDHQ